MYEPYILCSYSLFVKFLSNVDGILMLGKLLRANLALYNKIASFWQYLHIDRCFSTIRRALLDNWPSI